MRCLLPVFESVTYGRCVRRKRSEGKERTSSIRKPVASETSRARRFAGIIAESISLVCSSSSHVLRTFPPPSNLPENGNCKEIISRKERGATPVCHPFGDKFVRKWVQPLFVIHLVTRGAGGMPPDWRQEPCRCKPKAGPEMARGRHTKQSAATCVRFIQLMPDANPAPHVGCLWHPTCAPGPHPMRAFGRAWMALRSNGAGPCCSGPLGIARTIAHRPRPAAPPV